MNARALTEETAPLPSDRVSRSAAFEVTGVEFAGPLYVRVERSTQKCYIVLFPCVAIRTVHLELVQSRTTKAFLCAFCQFISLRSTSKIVYSDNALSFRRSNNDLTELWSISEAKEL